MSHVQIKTAPDGAVSVVVDGIEMGHNIIARGFRVEFPAESDQPAQVHLALAADTVNIDLVDAEVTS